MEYGGKGCTLGEAVEWRDHLQQIKQSSSKRRHAKIYFFAKESEKMQV